MTTSAERRASRNGVASVPAPDAVGAALVDPAEVPLDEAAEMVLTGFLAKQELAQRQLAAELERTHRLIERFAGVPAGAIGTTHQLVAGSPPRLKRVAPGPA